MNIALYKEEAHGQWSDRMIDDMAPTKFEVMLRY